MHSLYGGLWNGGISWKQTRAKLYGKLELENARLKAELARVEE